VKTAGASHGVEVYKHPQNSDAYFLRSDNGGFAHAGVPAHTLTLHLRSQIITALTTRRIGSTTRTWLWCAMSSPTLCCASRMRRIRPSGPMFPQPNRILSDGSDCAAD